MIFQLQSHTHRQGIDVDGRGTRAGIVRGKGDGGSRRRRTEGADVRRTRLCAKGQLNGKRILPFLVADQKRWNRFRLFAKCVCLEGMKGKIDGDLEVVSSSRAVDKPRGMVRNRRARRRE